jgi:hypothetical protein
MILLPGDGDIMKSCTVQSWTRVIPTIVLGYAVVALASETCGLDL